MSKCQVIYDGSIELDPTYHGWPTLCRTQEGELLAVCSGKRERHVCPYGRVLLYRSSDEGRTWSGPQQLSHGPLDDRDAGICQLPDGSLVVNYFTSLYAFCLNVETMPESWREITRSITLDTINKEHGFWMMHSTDNGKSWSPKYLIPLNTCHGATLMNDGSLLMAGRELTSSAANIREGSRSGDRMLIAKSGDAGKNWEILSEIPMPPGHISQRVHEPHAVQLEDGTILVHTRDHNVSPVQTWQTSSRDGGKSWSEPVLLHTGFPTHLLSLGGSKALATYGWRNEPYGIRARFTEDAGQNWQEEIILYDKGINHDLGYPSTVRMADGSFFTLWYENTGRIAVLKYCRWQSL